MLVANKYVLSSDDDIELDPFNDSVTSSEDEEMPGAHYDDDGANAQQRGTAIQCLQEEESWN